jgi:hypothetical protein
VVPLFCIPPIGAAPPMPPWFNNAPWPAEPLMLTSPPTP